MNRLKIFLAFALGCLVASVIEGVVVRVKAQGEGAVHVCVAPDGVLRVVPDAAACPQGQRSLMLKRAEGTSGPGQGDKKGGDSSSADKARLEDLERRLNKLEGLGCAALGKSKVVAPFEVVDRKGKRIFYVNEGLAELYNGSGEDVAWIAASNSGGDFVARSTTANLLTTFGASGESSGMTIAEGGKTRLDLGRRPDKGTYRVLFNGSGGAAVAGIGQAESGSGLAFVADSSGVIKARIFTNNKDGKGRINISRDTDGGSIAELTEALQGGGKLFICTPAGCDPPMVEAGDAGGYGIVRAGPMGFNPGVGLLGLPGSFIMGKKQ